MPAPKAIHELFASDVTRDIPPVVYFHEQTPEKLLGEVSEYIITGGWPPEHPHHRRVPSGIHEQYVSLLNGIVAELDKKGGPELPNAWISGFYGSGKSSFAKLLGLALDGVALPNGRSLAEALLARDTSPRAEELHKAWAALRKKVDPIAAVFDVGAVARDNEQVHSVAVRQVQRRLGYCSTDPIVAEFELDMERDGEWPKFLQAAERKLKQPWTVVKDKNLAEEDFSVVMHELYPERYPDPMAWYASRAGTHTRSMSPEEAVLAIGDMLRFRSPQSTLFLVVDEVSQYVVSHRDRVDRLRAFATALGSTLKGKTWLLALGQQKLDEGADDAFLVWAKDRFPERLRVHLSPTNIRDVIHRRLLQKTPAGEEHLRTLFDKHRTDLKLYAYGCDDMTPDDFVEVYPLLPGQIDLLLQITSALRTRSSRAQGDDQAIRGLLQLLGELFRDQQLAEDDVGSLVTLDKIYEVQQTALDSDIQNSMARVLDQCAGDGDQLLVRVAKAVALLELIQETLCTDAKLVASCLHARIDGDNQLGKVTEALEELRRRNLLGYSEKHGYKIQSSAGEEWERNRRDIYPGWEQRVEVVQEALKHLVAMPERPRYEGRPFPFKALFSDGRKAENVTLQDPRDDAAFVVDLRFLTKEERDETTWVKRSAESSFENALLWVCGETEPVEERARELARSRAMVKRFSPRRESLNAASKLLLQQEENRTEELESRLREDVARAWMSGRLYFRGTAIAPADHGASFATALHAVATKKLPDIFSMFTATQVTPAELMQLLEHDLTGPSPKFLPEDLGILEVDGGKYVATCSGVVPRRVLEQIERDEGTSGAGLLAYFGGPSYGHPPTVLKACVAGLLRGSRIKVKPEGSNEITAYRDAGVKELFDKDRSFKRAYFFPAGEDDIGPATRARICVFFEKTLGKVLHREDHLIADAVMELFPEEATRLREVLGRLQQVPGGKEPPAELVKLGDALEACIRSGRQTLRTVRLLKKHLDVLSDGITKLRRFDSELSEDLLPRLRDAASVRDYQLKQLREATAPSTDLDEAGHEIDQQLSGPRPWQELGSIAAALETVRALYREERTRLLQEQEGLAEQARLRLKGREGFSTLSADPAHKVLRPLHEAVTNTTEDAIAPSLLELRAPFLARLVKAEAEANDTLDELLSEKELIVKVNLQLSGRELTSAAEVDALCDELRERLMAKLQGDKKLRVRLV
jgi:hypothetical protein